MQAKFDTPILIILFSRLEFSKQILKKVRTIKASNLYIACDLWREEVNGEKEKVLASRDYFKNNIDWECNTKYLYADKNLGSGEGVSKAISWFFENVDYGIILEEDCIPSLPFFFFCEEMLLKYNNDLRIWVISGINHFEGSQNLVKEDSYFFSRYAGGWGWATWANRWKKSNFNMKDYNKFIQNRYIFDHLTKPERNVAMKRFSKFYQSMQSLKPKTWDMQFAFTILVNRGLNIVPSENLVTNVGVEGVHAKKAIRHAHLLPASNDFKINKHPDFFLTNYLYEEKFFNVFRKKKNLPTRIVRKIKKLLTLNIK